MNTHLNGRLLSVALILAATAATAADFYVSSVHPSRNDANPGTSSNAPWATFDKVKASWGTTIKAGDTVHLARGSVWNWTWGSSAPYWVISQGGTASAPMVLRGDDYGTGAKPLLQRTGGTGWGTMIVVAGNASYVTLRDFAVDGGSAAGFGTSAITIGAGYLRAHIGHINILNITARNLGNSTAVYASGVEVAGYNNYSVSDCLIEGCDIGGYTGHGLNHYPQKTTYRTTSLNHRITWRNNRILGASPNVWSGVGAGIHIAFGGSSNVFEYNYVEGFNPAGSIMAMNCSNDETDMIIRFNVIRNNPASNGFLLLFDGNGIPGSSVSGSLYGNIFMNNRFAGVAFEPNNQISGHWTIYNNTFFDNRQQSVSSSDQGGDLFIGDQNAGLNFTVRNNLFMRRAHSGNAAVCLNIRSGYTGVANHNNNLFWHEAGTGSPAVFFKGATYTVAAVKTFEPTAQNLNPAFTDISLLPTGVLSSTGPFPSGLMIPSTSPAVDKGASLENRYAASINLLTRPQGSAWDIGAYEFGTGGNQVPAAPSAPSSLTAVSPSTNQVALTWTDTAVNETGFRIERSTDGAAFGLLGTANAGVTTFLHAGVPLGVTNYYRVCATSPAGASAYSPVATAMAGERILDNGGNAFSAVSAQDAWLVYTQADGPHWGGSHAYNRLPGTGSDFARWTFAPPAPGLYDVYAWWWEGAGRPPDVPFVIQSGGSSLVVRVDQRTNGGRWNALGTFPFAATGTVTLTDGFSSGADAVADAVRLVYRGPLPETPPPPPPPPPAPPPAPFNLTAVLVSSNQTTLAWRDASDNETGFRIERGTGGVFSIIGTTGANATGFVDSGFAYGVTNAYRVQALSPAGASAYSGLALIRPGEWILDNLDPRFSIRAVQDPWILYQDPAGQHYAGAHVYNATRGTGQDTATWTFTLPIPGVYELYAWWWEGAWRPPDVPFTVTHHGGVTTIKADQRANGGQWVLLGMFHFTGEGSVSVSDAVSEGGHVAADAIRLLHRPDIAVTTPMPPTGIRVTP